MAKGRCSLKKEEAGSAEGKEEKMAQNTDETTEE